MTKKITFLIVCFASYVGNSLGQPAKDSQSGYWNTNLKVTAWRLPPAPAGYKPKLVDLDKDGDPDLLYSVTRNNIPILWIDDDDDMTWKDLEGDTDNDCLLIDRNRDGRYGSMGDLIIDWVDSDGDGKADLQAVADYPAKRAAHPWPHGHYMWVMDTDKDNVMNYINWNTFKIEAWAREGLSDFMLDYSGKTAFLKTHVATYTMEDLRLNWENPFLFYDPDKDGLSEIAVRFVDTPEMISDESGNIQYQTKHPGKINWVSIAVDLDNDNGPGNDFDYDFSLSFRGKGFDYIDQRHRIKNLRGLPETDTFFMDPRFRQLEELIYPTHESAFGLIFKRGDWDKVYFVYDEDDDCNRWERVEFYDPLEVFNVGVGKKGLDNNSQSDVAGDRGEWDLDNSGGGKLYIGKFDGRLHLYGAEWGAWRIDQHANYYHGGDRLWQGKPEPKEFGTVKYVDTDGNGFFDKLYYDLDGDKVFEDSVSLKELGISDVCPLIDISDPGYENYRSISEIMSDQMWENARLALKVSEKYRLNTSWYAKLMVSSSSRLKYHNGYWLQFYLYRDLKDLFIRSGNLRMLKLLDVAYYSGNWKKLL
ncbi:MAG: hypothetical protein QM594_13360 [Niabella sp.]